MIRYTVFIALMAAAVAATPGCAWAQAEPIHKVEVIATAIDQKREVADLHAQEVSAWWTRAAAVAAYLSVGVSGFGLFFIWMQLRHSAAAVAEAARSSKAAAEAAQAAVLASRPWLKVTYADAGDICDDGDGRLRLVIPITMTNVGATPAITACSYAAIIEDGEQDTVNRVVEAFLARQPRNSETIFPGDSSIKAGWNVDLPDGSQGFWWVAALASYRFSGSTARHVSGVVLGVRMLGDEAPSFTEDGLLIWQARAASVPNLRVDAT